MSDSSITVVVRVRPFSDKERQLFQPQGNTHGFASDGSFSCAGKRTASFIRPIIQALDDRVLVFDPPETNPITKYQKAILPQANNNKRVKDIRYAFDRVFDETATQEEVYEQTTKQLIGGILNGYNSTVFAYGATGCGKTHTISGNPNQPGIIFLTMQELFDRINAVKDEKSVELTLTYLEIYNETIRDLLIPGGSKVPLQLREDSNERIVVAGLSEHAPQSVEEVMDMIIMGNLNRTMSPTEANATSSRSHAVLQINVKQKARTADISEDHTVATLSIIDLAGSERASVTKNRGERLLEGANINKSLLALGNCINALCDVHRKVHVPYRNSKLTRLLKFSLGGNCKTVMIVCVSPSSMHYDETHNTLKYANRAKNIKTKVSRNLVSVDRHVSQYVKVIYELRQEVGELKAKLEEKENINLEHASSLREEGRKVALECVSKLRYSHESAVSTEIEISQATVEIELLAMKIDMLTQWVRGASSADNIESNLPFDATKQVVSQTLQELHRRRLALIEKVKDSASSSAVQEQTWQTVQRRLKTSNITNEDTEAVERERDLLALQTEKTRLETQLKMYAEAMSKQSQIIARLLRASGEAISHQEKWYEGGIRALGELSDKSISNIGPAPPMTPSRMSTVPMWQPTTTHHLMPLANTAKLSSPLRIHKVGQSRKNVYLLSKSRKAEKKKVRWRDEEHGQLAESVGTAAFSYSSCDDAGTSPQPVIKEDNEQNVSPPTQENVLSKSHCPFPLREMLNTSDSADSSGYEIDSPSSLTKPPRRTSLGQIGKKRRVSSMDTLEKRSGCLIVAPARFMSPGRTKAIGMSGISTRIAIGRRESTALVSGKPTWR